MLFKKEGEDPGFASRYFEAGGVGWYTFLTCGGCHHTAEVANVVEAQTKGWARRPDWGWLCDRCLVRLKLKLSHTQQLALNAAPAGEWFRVQTVRDGGVRCALAVCRQLEQLGYLEGRNCESPPGVNRIDFLMGTPAETRNEYRVLPQPPAAR